MCEVMGDKSGMKPLSAPHHGNRLRLHGSLSGEEQSARVLCLYKRLGSPRTSSPDRLTPHHTLHSFFSGSFSAAPSRS